MSWTNRLMNLFWGGRLDAEIEEELRFHTEARVSDNLAAGMTTEEARRDATRRFGGYLQAREATRDTDVFVWIETIAQDARYALRSFRKNLGVNSIAALSLALAIGANTAIFSIVNAVLLRSFPYKDSGRIAMLWTSNALNGAMEQNTSIANLEDWRARSGAFEEMAFYRESDGPLMKAAGAAVETEWIGYAFVSENFFSLLGRFPILGRVFGKEEFENSSRVVVLSHRLWQRRFHASADILGKALNVGGLDCEVIGVMPDNFQFPSKEFELWAPASIRPRWQESRAQRGSRFGTVLARLSPGASFEQARAEMRVIAAQLEKQYPEANENLGVNIVPLQIQLNGKSVPFMLAILFGAVMFVLMIACANVANLLLARGVARAREIALRAALGAGRNRIARQLLTESVLLSILAGSLGLPLAAWTLRALIVFAPRNIARLDEVRLDGPVLLFTLALSLITGVLFGLAPAIRMSRSGPNDALRANPANLAGRRSAQAMRGVFVVCQFSLAVVLLAGAGLLIRSLLAIQSVDAGFGERNVVTAHLRFHNALPRERRVALYKQAMERIGRLPAVRAVGAISTMFWNNGGGKFGLRAVDGRPPDQRAQWTPLTWTTVSGDYFQALSVPLLRGRFFSDQDRQDSPPVVLVNETMARRYWPGEDPVGKRIKGFDARGRNDDWVSVIGVVKDVRSGGIERKPMAQIFETQSQSLDETENLVVSAAASGGIVLALRSAVRELDRTAVVSDFSTIEQRISGQSAQRRFQTYVLSVFAALALVLAGAGIFGMMHYSVAQRTQEIGIRMALGARRSNVFKMVFREGLALAAAGVGLGLAGSLALMQTISSLLFGVKPEDPTTLGVVALTLTAIALAVCYIPARRATKVDPITALRCE